MLHAMKTIAVLGGTVVAILTLQSGCLKPSSPAISSEPPHPAPQDDGIDDSIRAIKAEIQKRNDLDAATMREASSKSTGSPSAELLYTRAELYRKVKQFGHAIKDLDEAIRLKADWADLYALRAACQINLRDRERAKIDCQKALSLDSSHLLALSVRTLMKIEDNDLAGAMDDALAAVRSDPSNYRGYSVRARVHWVKKEFDQAVNDWNQAIHSNPNEAYLYSGRGIAFAQLKSHERALADWKRALEIDPREASAHFSLGLMHNSYNRFNEAIIHLRVALDLGTLTSNQSTDAITTLSRAYLVRGISKGESDVAGAISDWQKSLEYSADNQDAHFFLGVNLANQNDPAANFHLNKAIESGRLDENNMRKARQVSESLKRR